MQQPGARIICRPPYHKLLPNGTSAHYIAANGVHVVERAVPCALHDIEVMLMTVSTSQLDISSKTQRTYPMQVYRMLVQCASDLSIKGRQTTYGPETVTSY